MRDWTGEGGDVSGRRAPVKEACGVVGVVAPGHNVAHGCYDGLYALQHRGQESAGMATSDGRQITVVKDNGLVNHVFTETTLQALTGSLAIGHTRYSTSGSANWTAAQPAFRSAGRAGFALAHNGNLTNTHELATAAGLDSRSLLSDSDLLAELIARVVEAGATLPEALHDVLRRAEGAFSLVVAEADAIHAVRDPYGFRPLCLGRLGPAEAPTGWVVASETPALDVMGAAFVREVAPGEMVTLSAAGAHWTRLLEPAAGPQRLCVFEFVYFARPDAYLLDHQVHSTRRRMGSLLAATDPVAADLVIGVPDSGIPAAEGYAQASGTPFGQGLVKNRYIGRTFLAPDQDQRAAGVRRKLNPLRETIAGQRLVVVDDSVVRGTTTRALVRMLRDAGAREVHLRISSPPFRWPCYYGIDTPTREELLATRFDLAGMCEFVGADSLAFLSLADLRRAVGVAEGCCDACLTGTYPAPVPVTVGARGGRR